MNATLSDVVEQLNLAGAMRFPVTIPLQLDVVSVFYRSNIDVAERGRARVSVLHPGGRREPSQELVADLSEYFRTRLITRIAGLPVSGPGLYFMLVEQFKEEDGSWFEVARVPFNVFHKE